LPVDIVVPVVPMQEPLPADVVEVQLPALKVPVTSIQEAENEWNVT
jgi:hypothetical protein